MKVLYVASNPDSQSTLALEKEITDLQRRFSRTVGEPVEFIFLPNLNFEDLAQELARHEPDILHISAHSDTASLAMRTDAGHEVRIDSETLATMLPPDRPPSLIFVNSCDSEAIASGLARGSTMAIGTTAPVTNKAARASAVQLYDRLLQGRSVAEAHRASKAMLKAINTGTCTSELHFAPGTDPEITVLHRFPRILARIESVNDMYVSFNPGLYGCPSSTSQTVFMSNDDDLAEGPMSLEENLSTIVRAHPIQSVIWADIDWITYGELRIYACATAPNGNCFALSCLLCEAIHNYSQFIGKHPGIRTEAQLNKIVNNLRENDGSGLRIDRSKNTKILTGKKKAKKQQ